MLNPKVASPIHLYIYLNNPIDCCLAIGLTELLKSVKFLLNY